MYRYSLLQHCTWLTATGLFTGPLYGALAMASNGLLRYTFAAALPLFSTLMFERLGTSWAASLLGFFEILLFQFLGLSSDGVPKSNTTLNTPRAMPN